MSSKDIIGDGPSEPVPKRRRGPAWCVEVNRLPEGQRLPITLDDRDIPVGDNVPKLQNFLGTLARDGHICPLDCHDWRHFPESGKEHVWNIIQEKFELSPTLRHYVFKSLGKKWRDYKSALKSKYYDPYQNYAQRYANKPSTVLADQWHSLVQFWSSELGQTRSEKNKASRSKQEMSHTAGTKSFARVRDEEKKKSSSQTPPHRAGLFILTHRRKDGTPIDKTSAEKISQMEALRQIDPERAQDNTCRNDVFSQVMGPERYGHVRGCGFGPTPTSMWGSSSSQSGTSDMNLREKLISMVTELIELRGMIHHLSRQLAGQTVQPETHVDRGSSAVEGESCTHTSDMDPSPDQ